MAEYILIAQILSAFGKDGFVRIYSHSDFPERFFELKKIYIDFFDVKKMFYVEEVKKIKDFFIVKFKNFDKDEDVAILTGKYIYIEESEAVKLSDNEFFIHDLVGSLVFRNDILVGEIKEVLSFPANDVYVIDKEGKELLIPAVKEFVEKFLPAEKKLFLKPDVDIEYDED